MIEDKTQFSDDVMYMAALLARADGQAEISELALPAIYLATYWNVDRATIEKSLKCAAQAIGQDQTPDASAIAQRLVSLDSSERNAIVRVQR